MRALKIEKKPSLLDNLVGKFVKIIEKYTCYAIVSGYVSILLGEERPTQDVDIIISPLEKNKAKEMYGELLSVGFEIPENFENFFKIPSELKEKVDVFTQEKWYFDLKVAKDLFDRFTLENRIKVIIGPIELFISPPEIQIPYKLYLGAEKDIKDATFLYHKLRNIIDEEKLELIAKEMKISLEILGNEKKKI